MSGVESKKDFSLLGKIINVVESGKNVFIHVEPSEIKLANPDDLRQYFFKDNEQENFAFQVSKEKIVELCKDFHILQGKAAALFFETTHLQEMVPVLQFSIDGVLKHCECCKR